MVGSRRKFIWLSSSYLHPRLPPPDHQGGHPPERAPSTQQWPLPSSTPSIMSTIVAPHRRGRDDRDATATRIRLAATAAGRRAAPALPVAADGAGTAAGGCRQSRYGGRRLDDQQGLNDQQVPGPAVDGSATDEPQPQYWDPLPSNCAKRRRLVADVRRRQPFTAPSCLGWRPRCFWPRHRVGARRRLCSRLPTRRHTQDGPPSRTKEYRPRA